MRLGGLLLRIKALRRTYDNKNQILNNLNLELEPGLFHVLLGRNGSGKSTLMRILSGQDSFNDGEVIWNGKSFGEWGIGPRPEVAYVAEGISVSPFLTLREVVIAHQEICGDSGSNWANRIEREVGFDLSKKPSAFSRGQTVRILIELALLRRPKLLILDEITSVLDALVRRAVFLKLEEFLSNGGTIVLATNIISEVTDIADKYHLLEKGQISVSGSLSQLCDEFKKFRARPENFVLSSTKGAVEVDLGDDGTIGYVVRSDQAIPTSPGIVIETPSLSDVFVFLTKIGA